MVSTKVFQRIDGWSSSFLPYCIPSYWCWSCNTKGAVIVQRVLFPVAVSLRLNGPLMCSPFNLCSFRNGLFASWLNSYEGQSWNRWNKTCVCSINSTFWFPHVRQGSKKSFSWCMKHSWNSRQNIFVSPGYDCTSRNTTWTTIGYWQRQWSAIFWLVLSGRFRFRFWLCIWDY